MTFASLEEDRDTETQRPRRITGPVLASAVLHGTLLYLIARVAVAPPAIAEIEERPYVKVVFDLRAPAQTLAEPTAPDAPELEPSLPAGPGASEAPAPTVAEPTTNTEALAEETEASPNAERGPAREIWTPARIRCAIATNATERRSAATTAWLTECVVEQKAHGTRDCEDQLQEQDYASASMRAARDAGVGAFARLTRPDSDWRRVQQFMRGNALMADLAEQEGAVGALATERLFLNNEYMRFLTGNGQDPMWESMNSGFKADALHNGRYSNLSLPGNIPFQCGRGKPRVGMASGGVGVSDVVPCIYNFNGFTIEGPDTPVEANAFRIVPSVPGSQQ